LSFLSFNTPKSTTLANFSYPEVPGLGFGIGKNARNLGVQGWLLLRWVTGLWTDEPFTKVKTIE